MARNSKVAFYYDYDQLVEKLKNSENDFDFALIDKAYNLALNSHKNQKRVSGIPYILHPTSVAYILAELGMDTESIVTALLHDVVEDTDITIDYIEKNFGKEIKNLVNGVTKIEKFKFETMEERQAENVRKMLVAMSEDIRVIIIKLADRLHNMRTINCMRPQKRRDKARESMEIFAPIAHRLGIRTIKEELEDLSLRQLDPIAYKEIQDALTLKKAKREAFIETIKKRILINLSPYLKKVHLEGRVKSTNGIYRKIFIKHRLMEEIYDIYAVRVIVDSVNDCYNVLGIIHDIYRPIPNRFKDYISTPKPNMYQSLHTTVIGREGIPFEVQIRTWDMHHTAEYGVAAHWKYKLGLKGNQSSLEKHISWIKNMIESHKGNEFDLMKTIKSDLVPKETFALTPKGDVISLPTGATVIDFAYAIHTEVGNKMIGAKIDKRIVPLSTEIKTGQIVEILTTKDLNKGPTREWLNIVKTSEARNKIRQWFKRERLEENILEGKSIFEKECKKFDINVSSEDVQKLASKIGKSLSYTSSDKLFEELGYGGISLTRITPRIKKAYSKEHKKDKKPSTVSKENSEKLKRKNNKKGIIVENIDNCSVHFSKCCNPIPGDDVIGFITRGKGVSIHKKTCKNVPKNIDDLNENERWVKVSWDQEEKNKFKSNVRLVSIDDINVLADVTSLFSKMNIEVHSFSTRKIKDNKIMIDITITVKNKDHLSSITSKLLSMESIISVSRI